jgi:small-conductance mechanosensitive channel
MKMRKLLAIPGFVLLAIGCFFIYDGMIAWHLMAGYGIGSGGFLIAIIGVFLILLSGVFKGIIEKRWGHNRNGP